MAARRIALIAALALTTSLLSAPAHAWDPEKVWPGRWETDHQYGQPTLRLTYDGEELKGTYSENGKVKGNINGTLSYYKRIWSGTYRDREGGGRGKFSVFLKEGVDEYEYEFEGWFKPRGGDRIDWFGYKGKK